METLLLRKQMWHHNDGIKILKSTISKSLLYQYQQGNDLTQNSLAAMEHVPKDASPS